MADTLILDRSPQAAVAAVRTVAMPAPTITAMRALPFLNELRLPGQLPWIRYYRTAGPALHAALWNRASVSLFHFESNCLAFGLPASKGESDEAKFARWCLGAERATKWPVHEQAALGGIAPVLGIHDDGTRDVLEILRINSATPTVDPAVSNMYFYNRVPLQADIKSGNVDLLCQPDGWGMYAQSRILHSGPALALADGTVVTGPHLPEPGRMPMGQNRVFRKPGAEMLADDVG